MEKDRTCVSHFVPAEELDISAPDQTNWPALMIPIFALNGSFYAFAKTQAEVGDLTVMQLLIHASKEDSILKHTIWLHLIFYVLT